MFEVTKQSNEHYLVGLVLEPDAVDTQNDVVSKAEVEKACHDYNRRNWPLWKDHQGPMSESDAAVVESYITESPMKLNGKSIKPGSWLLKLRISETIYKAALDGRIAGFSVAGVSNVEQ